MVYCLQARLAFSTAARRDAVLADIQSRIAGRTRWGADVLAARVDRAGRASIVLELRFTSRADQENVRTRIESFASGQRTPLAGSWLRLHDCGHDEAVHAPCVPLVERTW